MMITIYRDLGFFMLSLVIYDLLLSKGVIYFFEVCLLLGMTVLYAISIYLTNSYTKTQLAKQSIQKQDVIIQKRELEYGKDRTSELHQPGTHSLEFEVESMEEEESNVLISKKERTSLCERSDRMSVDDCPKEAVSHSESCNGELQQVGERESQSRVLLILERLCWPALTILHFTLPIETLPEFSFLAIVGLFFLATDFILTVVSVFSVYSHLSHILIALTVISWGSSPIELINLVIANRKNELQMGLTSILSGIVLAFFVIIPLAMIFKMMRRSTHELQIL